MLLAFGGGFNSNQVSLLVKAAAQIPQARRHSRLSNQSRKIAIDVSYSAQDTIKAFLISFLPMILHSSSQLWW